MKAPLADLSWEAVRRERAERNFLYQPAGPGEQARVTAAVGGVQAQVLSAARLALGARVGGIDRVDVEAELWERRGLVKTYGPRGTLHLLPAGELPLWMAAMRARESLREEKWYTRLDIAAGQAQDLVEAVGQALDGRSLTRQDLASAVGEQLGDWARQKLASTWGECLGPAAYAGYLCFGPQQGSQVTYVRADRWIANWEIAAEEPALLEVLRRYLSAYGPATAADFARWFWLPLGVVEGLFDQVAAELVKLEVEGRAAWALVEMAGNLLKPRPPAPLRLLPQYDCYLLGSGPREKLVSTPSRQRIRAYRRGRFEGAVGLPVVLVDGLVQGIWALEQRARKAVITIEPHLDLSPQQKAAALAEAERIGAFLNTPVEARFGTLGEG